MFNKTYEKQNYTMKIKYKSNKKHGEHFGALAWVDDNGKYSVRNPIGLLLSHALIVNP